MVVTLAADHASDRRWGAGQSGTINRENRAGPKPPDNIGDHARRIHPVQGPRHIDQVYAPGTLHVFFRRHNAQGCVQTSLTKLLRHERIRLDGNHAGEIRCERPRSYSSTGTQIHRTIALFGRNEGEDALEDAPPDNGGDSGRSRSAYQIGNFEDGSVPLLVLNHQHAEMDHGNLPVTHTYTSTERQPLLRSAHAKRSPLGGYVLMG